MKFDHLGDVAPVLLLDLAPGEKALVPPDRVCYRDPTVGVDRLKLSLPNPVPYGIGNVWEYFEVLQGPGTATVSIGRIGEIRVVSLAPGEVMHLHSGALLARDARTNFRLVCLGTYQLPYSNQASFFVTAELTGPGLVAFQSHGNLLSFNLAPGERLRAPPHSIVSIGRGTGLQFQVFGGAPQFPRGHYFPLVELIGPGSVMLHSGLYEIEGAPA